MRGFGQLMGWGWDHYNKKCGGVIPARKWKRVVAGEVYGELTVLGDGRGVERIDAMCSCGRSGRYMAASVKAGKVRSCAKCSEFKWVAPKKWVNPPKESDQDREILRIRKAAREKKELAKKNRH